MSIKYKVGIQIEGGALTVSGGSITLGGTGRIQGVDSVSVNTDAANKLYVDTQVATKDSYSQWKVQADSGSIFNVTSNTNVDFIGGTNITTSTGTQAGGLVVTINNGINNNNQLTNGAGYITSASLPTVNNPTVTFNAGTGLTGGGSISMNQSNTETITFNNSITNNNQLTNGAGYTTNVGDITAVSAGSGMSGGGTSGAVTLTNADKGSSQAIYKNFAVSGQNTVVADSNNDTMTFVATGGMSITTNNATDTITFNPNDNNDNYYVTGASQSGGTLTLTRQGLSTLTATGFTNASNSQTFTNKGGNISQWTNNSGYITAGSLPTVNNATITLTAGTGLSGGGTITLNQASNETVTFNNSITNNNQLTNGAGYTTNTGTTTASNSQTFTNKGGNISQWTNDSGYVTSSGGSMSSWTLKEGNGTETSNVTNGETVTFAQGSGIQTELTSTSSGGTLTITNTRTVITNNNQLTNGAGYTTSVGDITGVTAGTGMSGGGTSGTVTLNCTVPVITNNNQLTNGAGYVTSEGSNNFVTGGNVTSGTLTLNRSGLSNVSFTINNVQITNGAGYTTNIGTTTPSNTQTFTNKSGNISQWSNNSGYTTNTGTTTASNSQTFTNKGGNISQWTNDSGYVTSSGGSMSSWNLTADGGGSETITNTETVDIAGGTNITTARSGSTVTINNSITNNNQLSNGAGYVTSSGGSMSTWNLTADSGGTESISNNETVTIQGGFDITTSRNGNTITITNGITNNNQLLNGKGYTTNTGTLTGGGAANQLAQWNALTGLINTKITESSGFYNFNNYTSTSTQSGASSLSPIQNAQAATQDSVAQLAVDPSGNLVRSTQEATWTFTTAQLNALSGTRVTILSAPGSGKCLCVEESNWLIESDSSASGTFTSDITCEIAGATVFSVATRVTKERLTTLAGSIFNGLAIYTRDVPETDKQLQFNQPMTIRIPGGTNQFPAKLLGVKLKIRYRVFDKNTF